MPTIMTAQIPPPETWQEFQHMICDLFKEIWEDPHATEYGRVGQKQYGADIVGIRKNTGTREIIQCKAVQRLTIRMVKEEYQKAKNLSFPFERLIIATTAKKDTRVQDIAINLSDNGPYRCDLLFWEDIKNELQNYNHIIQKYYNFVVFEAINNDSSKIVYVDIKGNHYELLITRTPSADKYYGKMLLVADLLNCRCQTYQIGDHWSRLEGFIGYGKYDAYLISRWLNSFGKADKLFKSKSTQYKFSISKDELFDFIKSLNN